MFLQTTLLFKTVLILSSQLAIVLVTSFALLKGAKKHTKTIHLILVCGLEVL